MTTITTFGAAFELPEAIIYFLLGLAAGAAWFGGLYFFAKGRIEARCDHRLTNQASTHHRQLTEATRWNEVAPINRTQSGD